MVSLRYWTIDCVLHDLPFSKVRTDAITFFFFTPIPLPPEKHAKTSDLVQNWLDGVSVPRGDRRYPVEEDGEAGEGKQAVMFSGWDMSIHVLLHNPRPSCLFGGRAFRNVPTEWCKSSTTNGLLRRPDDRQ